MPVRKPSPGRFPRRGWCRCLGSKPGEEHEFMSDDSVSLRICPRCAERLQAAHLSPQIEHPMIMREDGRKPLDL